MNKILPILVIVVIGLGIIGGAAWYFLLRSGPTTPQETNQEEEETVKELPLEQRPYTTLTPSKDGHSLHLHLERMPSDINSFDYELGYKTASGVNEGVTGYIKLSSDKTIDRDLLLGSCSSGKCRYHEGVEYGTITLKLRDREGKLTYRLTGGFHLQSNTKELNLPDQGFEFSSNTSSKNFYVTMSTIGLPAKAPGQVSAGPVGVFTSGKSKISGKVNLENSGTLYNWTGSSWVKLENSTAASLGTFIKVTE